MLVAKLGGVPAHPANVHRLLHDEEQLVLVFPEGRKGTEKLYKDRYRLRRFGRGGFVESAMRAKAPIVPVAVVGAEEAMPVFAQLNLLKKLTGPHLLPDHADVPAARAASAASATCRRSSRSASWSRSRPTSGATSRRRQGPRADGRRGGPRAASRRSSTRCSPSASRCGSDEARVLITGLSSYWGGRLAQELETRRRRRGDHRRRAPRTRRSRSSAPSSSASAPSTRCCAGSCTRPRSTR